MLLYIIRHGDPNYEKDCLTPLGKRQAEAVGRRLAIHGMDRIFSSPLGRAKETAQPLCEMLRLECNTEEFVSEHLAYSQLSVDMGNGHRNWVFRSLPDHEFKNEHNLRLNIDEWKNDYVFNKTDMTAAMERIAVGSDTFLEKLGYKREGTAVYRCVKPTDERVAVFCHEGAGMTWISHLLGIPAHIMWSSFEINHTSVTLFRFSGSEGELTAPKCLCFSDNSHLLAERLPYRHYNSIDI